MDSNSFVIIHKALVWNCNAGGLSSPQNLQLSVRASKLLDYYSLFTLTFTIGMFVFGVLGCIFYDFEGGFAMLAVANLCDLNVSFYTIYFLWKKEDFLLLISHLDEVTKSCCNDPLSPPGTFRSLYENNLWHVKMLGKYGPRIESVLPLIYCLNSYLQYQGYFGMDREMELPVQVWLPFEQQSTLGFQLILLYETMTLVFCVVKQFSVDCFFIALFSHLICFSQYLRSTFPTIYLLSKGETVTDAGTIIPRLKMSSIHPEQDNEANPIEQMSPELRIKIWAKLHQQVLSVGNDTTRLYAPIFLMYLLNALGIVSFTAYGVTTTGSVKGSQYLSVGSYAFSTVLSLLILCLVGTGLQYHSLRVADLGYCNDLFTQSEEVKSSMKIIFQRVQTPIKAIAYGSNWTDLANDTFAVFCKSMVSFYLALVQIRDRTAA